MAETTVAESIRIVDEKAAYDAACKRVLAEKIILAWIMKHCLIEFRDCEVSEIAEKFIEGTPQVSEIPVAPDETNQAPRIAQTGVEDKTLTEGTITYDIRFNALAPVSGELIGLIINLEAQNKYDPGYPLTKRGIETTTLQSIQSLMETLQLTTNQAMAALKIPEKDREKYIEMLKQ